MRRRVVLRNTLAVGLFGERSGVPRVELAEVGEGAMDFHPTFSPFSSLHGESH